MPKRYETTVFEGTPQEIEEMMNGPQIPDNTITELRLATQLLNKRYDEVQKAMEVLLNAGHNKKTTK